MNRDEAISPTWARRLLGALVVLGGALAACTPAPPQGLPSAADPVTDWVAHTAAPLAGIAPDTPNDDLAPLARSVGAARIVGLGESTHGVAEQISLKHRALRLLVEQLGFRSLAWEEDWTLGLQINDYLRGGTGDPDALVARMSPQWQSREVADVLRWLRGFNDARPDKVQFVGVEYYATPSAAYDRVEAYIAKTAPDRSRELGAHLHPIRPTGSDIYQYLQSYRGTADKQTPLRHARAVQKLVDTTPHGSGDRDHDLALHTARQIVSFYEHYQMSDADSLVFRDARAAENLRWWSEHTGGKTVYWAAGPHTAAAPELRISGSPGPDMRFPSAGSYLRRWYGPQYRSIGVTVGSGSASLGFGQTADLPEPAAGQFERPLADAGPTTFTLDLHRPSPPAVRRWLNGPGSFRGLPDRGPDSRVDGGAPAQWFDVIIHQQTATPTEPMS